MRKSMMKLEMASVHLDVPHGDRFEAGCDSRLGVAG